MNEKLPVIIFLLSMVSLIVIEVIRSKKESRLSDESKDEGSLKLIARCRNAAFLVGIITTFFPLVRLPGSRNLQWLTGAAFVFAGVALRYWAISRLGHWFSSTVGVQAGHQLAKDGPYKYIRHPAYAGAYLVFFGFGVATGSWPGLVMVMTLIVFAFQRRIAVEEKVMLESLGDEYRDYLKSTKKIIPFIF
jgi:protein-S-isoprenylcysteine O-methyltransferase Ste14